MQSQQQSIFQRKSKHHFNRLFPELEPLVLDDAQLATLAQSMMMQPRSPMDSQSMTNGVAIFSQFLAHDLTFESTSTFNKQQGASLFQNDRTVNLDLDCVYGQFTQDFYYDKADRAKLLLGKSYTDGTHAWHDLQRNAQGKALIPDARNDENIIVSRMQVLFLAFHNFMVDRVVEETEITGDAARFHAARRQVLWYYHWLILEEYLRKIMDPTILEDLLTNGCQFFQQPHFMPLEFSGAAFRIGHSQTRELNRINETTEKSLMDLGFFEEMTEYVDWHYIFDFGDEKVAFARKLDTIVEKAFHDLPFVKDDDPIKRSLPFRNLKRGVVYQLPSGEDVARRLGIEPIQIAERKSQKLPGTPLWFYILREASLLGNQGEHLGPVGSILLGECFLTLMKEDDESYLKLHPKWKPSLGAGEDTFFFTDMIRLAGMG